jgi:hypothetical protein
MILSSFIGSYIELQEGDVVVLRNGQYKVVCKDMIHGKSTYTGPDEDIYIDSYNPTILTHKHNKKGDIMAIYRFTNPDAIDPKEQYVSSDLESFVIRNLKGVIHWGINTVFERK